MAFEVFQNEQPRTLTWPTVTITARGVFNLSPAAVELLGTPRAVELLYDPATRIIGLRAVDLNEAPHGYLVRYSAGRATVSGTAFTSRYEIPTRPTIRRQAYMYADVLCLDLDDPGLAVTSNRAKR